MKLCVKPEKTSNFGTEGLGGFLKLQLWLLQCSAAGALPLHPI